jgi:membrane-bound lytic murein transglycosylase B
MKAGAAVMALALLAAPAAGLTKPPQQRSVYAQEQDLAPAQLIKRWNIHVQRAARRFGVPVLWINAVMRMESGGRTMLGENQPMVSDKGAIGLMQVMPDTYAEMRRQYRLGADPFQPRDNILAGAAYLRWLKGKYPPHAMFAAYNAGPGRVDDMLAKGTALPAETKKYVAGIARILGGVGGPDGTLILAATLTRPDGTKVAVDPIAVRGIRMAFPGEYPGNVQAVLDLGGRRRSQAVTEDVATATRAIREHGGSI